MTVRKMPRNEAERREMAVKRRGTTAVGNLDGVDRLPGVSAGSILPSGEGA